MREPRLLLARLLRRRVLAAGERAVVAAADAAAAADLDRYLWTWAQGEFLPHCLAEDEAAAQTPVVIASPATAADLVPVRETLLQLAAPAAAASLPAAAASYRACVTILPAAADLEGYRALHEEQKRRGHEAQEFHYEG